MNQTYTIGQLAKAADVNVETIRYYERRGLITQPRKPAAHYRSYPSATLARIFFIKRAQQLGFTLDEIGNLLSLDDASCREVQDMALQKLASVRGKLADLRRLERVLKNLLDQCAANPDQTDCPIIETLLPHHKRNPNKT